MIARLWFPPDPIERIEARLLELVIPQQCVTQHVTRLRVLQASKEAKRMREEAAFKHRVTRAPRKGGGEQ